MNDPRLHFGLGEARVADIEIRWPSGLRQAFAKVEADCLVEIDERKGITAKRKPPFSS